jgi:ATP-dependent DNA ligase
MLLSALGASKRATLTADDFRDGVTAQRKLNGVRLVAFLDAGAAPGAVAAGTAAVAAGTAAVVFYSRSGLKYPGLSRVAADLRRLAAAAGPGPAGAAPYFDGELYVHGRDLAWISGQARRADDDASLVYHVFDVFFPAAKAAGVDTPYRERRAYLDAAFAAAAAAGLACVVPVAAAPAASAEALAAFAAQAIADGYEGAVARRDAAGYTYSYRGYHSADALKIKPTFDAEFRVVGFSAGRRGKDAGALIWECATAAGRRFTVVPKSLTLEARRALYRCLGAPAAAAPRTRFEQDLAGRPITLEYRELSADGIPLQAKAVTFRTYEDGAAADPWAALLRECAGIAPETSHNSRL